MSKNIDISGAKKVYDGIIFSIYQKEVLGYNGKEETHEYVARKDSVFGIFHDGKGNILLNKESQPGREDFYSFPGGRIEDNEDAKIAMQRELQEETGYHCDTLQLWYSNNPVAKMFWTSNFFVGRIGNKTETHFDSGEKIETLLLPFDTIIEMSLHDNFRILELRYKFLRAKYDNTYKKELENIIFSA